MQHIKQNIIFLNLSVLEHSNKFTSDDSSDVV